MTETHKSLTKHFVDVINCANCLWKSTRLTRIFAMVLPVTIQIGRKVRTHRRLIKVYLQSLEDLVRVLLLVSLSLSFFAVIVASLATRR